MKKVRLLIISLFVFFINISLVSANSIKKIDVDVKLDSNGNGHITEIWNMNVDKGTEVYKSLSDFGSSNISDFNVSMDGEEYTSLDKWDIDASFSEKNHKNGIHRNGSKIELCWGMSTYGKHIYTISYDVTNMIYNTDDAQVLYWRFLDNNQMDPDVKEYTVKVSGPQSYADSLDVWGYGNYGGYAYVKDGVIGMSNPDNKTLGSSEYVVLLTKFPLDTFTTTNRSVKYKTFDDFKTKADEGAKKYDENDKGSIVEIIFVFIFIGAIIAIITLVIYSASHSNKYIKKEIDKKNLNNFRDIPCDKDIFKGFFIAKVYNLFKRKEDFLGALMLKWVLNKNVSIVKMQKKTLFGSKEITALSFDSRAGLIEQDEIDMYDMMKQASKDGVLEPDEMKRWSKDHYEKIYNWFNDIEEAGRNKYMEEHHVKYETTGKAAGFIPLSNYILDDTVYEDATKVAGLKKYLIEFSSMKEKEPIEVQLWGYYLIFAEIFGIAKQVSKQFEKLYPEVINEMNSKGYNYTYTDLIWLHSLSADTVSAASAAKSAAESYSAGGGGFSAGGGGGGSFGGGGGGCR